MEVGPRRCIQAAKEGNVVGGILGFRHPNPLHDGDHACKFEHNFVSGNRASLAKRQTLVQIGTNTIKLILQ